MTGSGTWANTLRVATWNAELARKHPTLLYRDIAKGGAADIEAALALIAKAQPDVIVLQSFDYDLHGHALGAFASALDQVGWPMAHRFARAPNTGVMTDVDLDGDGRTHGPRDAQGYGWFAGQGGMAVLSRLPIMTAAVGDHSELVWDALPWARLPQISGQQALSADVRKVQRLSTTGHWTVPIETPNGVLTLWTSHHTPPVFDGPEDRNGHRNADELRFWYRLLPGAPGNFVVLGDFNLDPERGDGLRDVIRDFLAHPAIRDPVPRDEDGRHQTAKFADPVGPLRVSYVLPAACLSVADSGMFWPDEASRAKAGSGPNAVSRHALVWVDLRLGGHCQGGER